uniref:G-protein coupled receptors family 1 profile domain-containing protein n=1 Tax=Plectus sambesii TaxID=2011161 RepID=A0A914USA1_9BILA
MRSAALSCPFALTRLFSLLAHDQQLRAYMPAQVLLNESVERVGELDVPLCGQLPNDWSTWGFVVNGIVTTIFVCLGIVGNLYHVRTLGKHSNSRLTRYLRVLCIWDVTLLTCTFGFYGFVVISTGYKPWYGDITYLYMVFYPLCQVSWTGSMFVVTAISAERYLAIARPFRKLLSEARSVTKICLLLLVAVMLINLPTFFELTQVSCYDEETNREERMIWLSSLRLNKTYMLIYRIIIYPLTVNFIPFITIVFLTIKTISVRRSAISRSQNTQSLSPSLPAKQDSGTTAVLTALIVKFLLCYSMPTILYVFEYSENEELNSRLIDISNFLIVFHSATNWLIFWRWNVNKSSRSLTQSFIFTKEEAARLTYLWANTRPTEVGRDLLYTLIRANRSLALIFANNPPNQTAVKQPRDNATTNGHLCDCRLSESSRSPACEHNIQLLAKVDSHGVIVGIFCDRIIQRLSSKLEQQAIIDEIRALGRIHYSNRVPMRNTDWMLAKQYLIAKLVKDECDIDAEDIRIVNKFASFLIHEVKCGRTCAIAAEASVAYGFYPSSAYTHA